MKNLLLYTFLLFSIPLFSQSIQLKQTRTEPTVVAYISGDKIIWEGIDIFGAKVKVVYLKETREKIYVERVTETEKVYARYEKGKVISYGTITLDENSENSLEARNR